MLLSRFDEVQDASRQALYGAKGKGTLELHFWRPLLPLYCLNCTRKNNLLDPR